MTDAELDALARRVAAIVVEEIGFVPASSTAQFVSPEKAAPALDKKNAAAVRHAINKGEYESGTEVIKEGAYWKVNPTAIRARQMKQQQKKKVC